MNWGLALGAFVGGWMLHDITRPVRRRLRRVYHARTCVVHPQDLHPCSTENCPKCGRIMKTIGLTRRNSVKRPHVFRCNRPIEDLDITGTNPHLHCTLKRGHSGNCLWEQHQ